MTPVQEATEVMMESQGLHAIYLGLVLGPDADSPLRFTSLVDATTFRYELEPGSTYLGLPITWETAGSRDAASGLWTWTTTGAAGGTDLGGTGEGGPFVGVDPPFHFTPFDLDPFKPRTIISDVTYTEKRGRFISSGTITVENPIVGDTKSKHTDSLITEGKDKGKWKWDTGAITDKFKDKEVKVVASGFAPLPDGGAGTFVVHITAVPEPATGLLALAGALGVGAWRRAARSRAAGG
jgi:hypothetical protein